MDPDAAFVYIRPNFPQFVCWTISECCTKL